jgi:hypothetical protein
MLHKLLAWGLLADPGLPYFDGGTVTEVDGYRIHTFTADDTLVVVNPGDVEIFLVGGGGGGGWGRVKASGLPVYTSQGGGGGAGGVIHRQTYTINEDLDIVIGAAGDGVQEAPGEVSQGGDTTIAPSAGGDALLTALGGGRGGYSSNDASDGGSGGGGASYGGADGGAGLQPSSESGGYGNDGTDKTGYGGGGGGTPSGYLFYGTYYARGGYRSSNPTAKTANTGDGGDGAIRTPEGTTSGGDGGSGIVIIRYPL